MERNKYWINFDNPAKTYQRSVYELRASELKVSPKPKPGGFYFDDGSTQGWTLDQIYDNNENPFSAPLPPGYTGGPFSLSNSQNLALSASTPFLVTTDSKITQCNIYLLSPDLSKSAGWQSISGYGIDVHRKISSAGGEPKPTQFWCQLQIYLQDKASGKKVLYAEAQGPSGPFTFHEVEFDKPYHFDWNPPSLSAGFTVTQLRIRLTSWIPSGTGAGELPLQGAWLVGNIAPH